MNDPLTRIKRGLLLLAGFLAIAVLGYRIVGQREWLDALYMVVITISTVGYTEHSDLQPLEKLFTIVVIATGITLAAYTIGGMIQMMTEGEIARALGVLRQEREMERLEDHVVLCGFGRMGQMVAQQLQQHRVPLVVVDHSTERVSEAQTCGFLALLGNAVEEEVLKRAGIERARVLVTALPSDAENVFITLTARNLNRRLRIIARGEQFSTRKKLIQAGADRVILPAAIGAQQIAHMILRPSTVELLELVTTPGMIDYHLDEVQIPEGSAIVGQTIQQIDARRRYGLLVVAVKRADGQMHFNPGPELAFQPGDTIIVMGKQSDLERFRQQCVS